MTRPPIDPRIRRWLDSGATEAPDALVEMVLAEFPSVVRRRGWRAVLSSRLPVLRTTLGVALTVAVIVGAAAWLGRDSAHDAGGPPGPSGSAPTAAVTPGPVPSRSPAPLPTLTAGPPVVFTSQAFAYSLAVPSGWSVSEGAGDWTSGTPTWLNRLGLDGYAGPRGLVLVGSRQVDAVTTLDSWTASVVTDSHSLGAYHWAAPERITLAGEAADLVVVTCNQCGEYYLLVTAVRSNSGWYLYWSSSAPIQPTVDRETFLELLAGFAFTD